MSKLPFSPGRVPWTLLLVVALLYVTVDDSRHDHGDGVDARSCYTCHFSPELGLVPGAGLPAAVPCIAERHALQNTVAPCAARERDYDARGPPLPG